MKQHLDLPASLLRAGWLVWVALALFGCGTEDACAEVGVVEICSCGTVSGARVCMAERSWGNCDCSGTIPLPNPVVEVDAGGGTGGISGSGGTGGISGSGGTSGTSGSGGTSGTSGSGGTSGTGGTSGSGGAPGPAYEKCTGAMDCAAPARCFTSMSGADTLSFCGPECLVASDCPRPAGAYDAVIRCVMGYCGIDCTPVLFQPLLSCPAGMTCVAPLFGGAAFCHDDGM